MKQIIFSLMALALLLTACVGKTNKTAGDADSVTTDSLSATTEGPKVDKHTEAYLRQRVDTIYHGKVDSRDAAYCSTRYYKLLTAALDVAEDNETLLLDCDHWTNSQDDTDFSYQIEKISDMTDSSAVVRLKAKNFGKRYPIILNMRFERDDWFVDDFVSDEGTSEKVYFEMYVERGTFYRRFSLEDLLYLTEHYAERSKAEVSGLNFVYHESQQDEEVEFIEYVYGRDIARSTKKAFGYELINETPHAFYFSISLDTSTNGRLYFASKDDANNFYERASKTKPFMFETKRIVVKKQPDGKSFLVQEQLNDTAFSTIFALHRPDRAGEYYEMDVEIYV